MATTLSDATITLTLPDDLLWADEFSWNPVQQSVEVTLTGALIVSVATRQAGRPITLAPPDDAGGAMTRALLNSIKSFADVPGKQMTLTIRGNAHAVVFRHHDNSAIDADPFVHYSDVEDGDFYLVTLRFMEV